jgi:hypothetical protein
MLNGNCLTLALCSLAIIALSSPVVAAESGGIQAIGIYNCYTALPAEDVPFFKACGYNMYQRWDLGWTIGPAKHAQYYSDMAREFEQMQRAGFKVFALLSINMIQRQAGEPEGYKESLFDPADATLMQKRLEYITTAVRKLKKADGFTIFAGDPGGHHKATPMQLFGATKKVMAIVRQEAPQAEIIIDTWGIAAWDKFTSPFSVASWEKEVLLTRTLTGRTDIIGPNVGMEFPLHNYYRSLALKCYVDAGKRPVLYPSAEEVAALKRRGVKRLWGWPYFLTDECDDGYESGTAGTTQAETRYLKQLIDTGRRLGLNGMTANAMAPNIFAESLNLYAFGRFCKDPAATPEQVIREFAENIAEAKSAGELAHVIEFIENRSTWQASLPQKYRLPDFDVGTLKSANDALGILAKLTVRERSKLPMTKPPSAYVEKLKERLQIIAKGESK